ncbi:hypothetical protein [Streptomyces sp. NPDC058142]|uniref:hypothetical protein n=1 Tax=Streptomyces sp. NPDC058142 TaxID=3346355 RepID=UPI0036E0A642
MDTAAAGRRSQGNPLMETGDFRQLPLCKARLAAKGADFELTDVGDTDHNTTALKALPHVVHGFTTAH